MAVLQHYYTSYINKQTGSIGFQVKAMSLGISPEVQHTIARLITYSIPPSLDERAIETHPVALRYYYEDIDTCILLCSQSTGSDDNGRPGNFFAHTLVMNPEIFTIVPPILYWKSPFWRKEDAEEGLNVSSLPILPEFDEEPSLDFDELWDFLAQGDRLARLYKLMCAVVHYNESMRRIVILDTTENVVWWIVAVSCLLPPIYRPLLSFATYHHDPYQGLFIITGTTSDSFFRATPQDYNAYFILNAEIGSTSDVEESPYAKMVINAASSDLYEQQLLTVFSNYVHRFPAPTSIDEQLDLIALYAQVQMAQYQGTFLPEELRAIHVALSTFEQILNLTQEDIDELRHLKTVLWEALKAKQEKSIQIEYERVIALLSRHDTM